MSAIYDILFSGDFHDTTASQEISFNSNSQSSHSDEVQMRTSGSDNVFFCEAVVVDKKNVSLSTPLFTSNLPPTISKLRIQEDRYCFLSGFSYEEKHDSRSLSLKNSESRDLTVANTIFASFAVEDVIGDVNRAVNQQKINTTEIGELSNSEKKLSNDFERTQVNWQDRSFYLAMSAGLATPDRYSQKIRSESLVTGVKKCRKSKCSYRSDQDGIGQSQNPDDCSDCFCEKLLGKM